MSGLPQRFISIQALYFYTQIPDYEWTTFLIYMIPGYPEMLENEVNNMIKATSLSLQYSLKSDAHYIDPEFGKAKISNPKSLSDLERAIRGNVRNIINLDINLIKLLKELPKQIQNNSFKLPQNVDSRHLINEYMDIKETQMISKILSTLSLFNKTQRIGDDTSYQRTYSMLPNLIFNNTLLSNRMVQKDVKSLRTEKEVKVHRHLIEFIDYFYTQDNTRYTTDGPEGREDIRSILIALAMHFDNSEDFEHIFAYFEAQDPPPEENSKVVIKRGRKQVRKPTKLTHRLAVSNSKNFMGTIVSLIQYETNQVEYQKFLEESSNKFARNHIVSIIIQMLNIYIQYTKFKSTQKNYRMKYSRLPLITIDCLDPTERPITNAIYLLQYALMFAPFFHSSI